MLEINESIYIGLLQCDPHYKIRDDLSIIEAAKAVVSELIAQ